MNGHAALRQRVENIFVMTRRAGVEINQAAIAAFQLSFGTMPK